VAGRRFSDYLCHRAAHIERTSGWPESVLHFLEMAEMAIPVMAALFLEINAAVILLMIVCFLLHQATALWDLYYAAARREVGPIEQHVHSFLEMVPLMGLLLVVALHWDQFISLFGFASPRFDFALKPRPLPWIYVATVLGASVIFAFFMLLAHLEGDARIIAGTARIVVIADFVFTATAVVGQPVTGVLLAREMNYSLFEGWIVLSIGLYLVTGLFWLPVVWMQMRMRDLATEAAAGSKPLPDPYRRLFRLWFAFGFPAFGAVLGIFCLMISRPALSLGW
jgi:uncharacterized membrane protein